MPLDKFVLLLVIVAAAAGLTIWLGAFLFAAAGSPLWAALLGPPLLLAGYVVWRVIADRLGNREDDDYDRIEK